MPPTPRKIKLAGEHHSIAVEWSDGHRSLYPYADLREKCPCATCTDAHGTGERPTSRPAAAPNPLALYEEPLKPEKAELVGRYALNITWSDGHSTGIYTFDYLRELCPCPECRAAGQGVGSGE
ncbi:MAG TPA: DUF971 domain-containing protein [Terriglobia bacterium]|nr:DUF971 domain-containing protein [Terriglobia bacterium]